MRPRLRVRRLARGETATIDAVFGAMSPTSRHQRFHAPVPELSARLRDALADVDGVSRVALVAEARLSGRWCPVGIAHLARSADHRAEVAVAVADDLQRRGVARRLAAELRQLAEELGLEAMTGSIQRENSAACGLLRSVFPEARTWTAGPLTEFVIPVGRCADESPLTTAEVLADLGVAVPR